MNTSKQTVTGYALELGFDLVRVTSTDDFVQDREIALERLRDGLMDGLPWYHQARVMRGPARKSFYRALAPSYVWASATIARFFPMIPLPDWREGGTVRPAPGLP